MTENAPKENKDGASSGKRGENTTAKGAGVVVIECGNRKNQQISFPPGLAINVTDGRIRGRWEKVNMGTDTFSESMMALNSLQVIPGGCIALDYGQRRGMVFDPLDDTPNQLSETIRRALGVTNDKLREVDAAFRRTFRHGVKPFQRRIITGMSNDDLASWHYWMQRIVRERNGRVIHGTFATGDIPGRIKLDYSNTHFGVPRFKDQYDKMAQEAEA